VPQPKYKMAVKNIKVDLVEVKEDNQITMMHQELEVVEEAAMIEKEMITDVVRFISQEEIEEEIEIEVMIETKKEVRDTILELERNEEAIVVLREDQEDGVVIEDPEDVVEEEEETEEEEEKEEEEEIEGPTVMREAMIMSKTFNMDQMVIYLMMMETSVANKNHLPRMKSDTSKRDMKKQKINSRALLPKSKLKTSAFLLILTTTSSMSGLDHFHKPIRESLV